MKKLNLKNSDLKFGKFLMTLLIFTFFHYGFSQSLDLFPEVPEFSANPYAVSMFDRINYTTDFPTNSFNTGKEVLQCAMAYNHPQKASFGLDQSAVESRLLFLLDGIFDRMESQTSGYYNSFNNVAETMLAYAMTMESNPSIISGANQASWESLMQSNFNTIISNRGDDWNDVKLFWYNADVRYGLALQLAGEYFSNPTYTSLANNMIEGPLKDAVLPDGGMHYVGYQNETFTYHVENIETVAWWYLMTKNQTLKDILRKSVNYYPLSIQDGVAEYYTAVSWKHYWNRSNGDVGAYITAAISGDKHNYRIGKTVSGELLPAMFYESSLTEEAQPDNYLLYDENIQGPRGKFGAWNFAASSRDASSTSESNVIGLGKKTFVGGMILTENDPIWPLNAAFDMATVEVKTSSGPETTDLRRRKHRFYSVDEENAIVMGKDFASLSTKYNISNKTSTVPTSWNPMPWVIDQQWILGKTRIVGRLGIESTSNQNAYAVRTFIKFVSGRNGWGTKKDWISLGNDTWSYGDLIVKVHTHDFNGGIDTGYTDTFSGTADKSGYMMIQDDKSFGLPESLMTYNNGDNYSCLIEIYPNSEAAASNVSIVSTGNANLEGYKVVESGKESILIANKKGTSSNYIFNKNNSYTYTTAFQSWDKNTQAISASQSITIPAYQHVLLVSSDESTEHVYNNNKYTNIFNTGSTIPVTGVNVSSKSLSLEVGQTSELTATISPSNATDKYVSWYSSNPSIATVNADGLVTAKGIGNAQITCTSYDGSYIATCDVTSIFIRIEAEDMSLVSATVQTHSMYSNGAGAQPISGTTGEASISFTGTSGTYDITVGYIGENDGQPLYKLYVNSVEVDSRTVALASSPVVASSYTVSDITVNNGDVIKLTSTFNGGAWGRMDYLQFDLSNSSSNKTTNQKLLVEEQELINSFIVYPNPVNDVIRFKFNQQEEGQVNLSIYDINRRLVQSYNENLNKGNQLIEIHVRDNQLLLQDGIYLFKLQTENFVENGKFIINR